MEASPKRIGTLTLLMFSATKAFRHVTHALALVLWLAFTRCAADDAFEQPPILYSATTPRDGIAELERRLASGDVKLGGEDRDILRELLRVLEVPEASQMLVFSKTSFQNDLIHPGNPRALYFSDTCYVGWVPGGLMEVAPIDPQLGPIFYQFNPHPPTAGPHFMRDADCLRCHGGTFVRDIPAVFARSLATDPNGQPIYSQGSAVVDDATPFAERWGGWYVTGSAGATRHRGNIFSRERDGRLVVDTDRGGNLATVPTTAGPSRYLRATSDIAALLVFEHQCAMQNALVKAAFQCRQILRYQQNLQRDLKEAVADEPTYDSAKRVFDACAQDVLDRLLFKDEAPLPPGAVADGGEFAAAYGRTAGYTRNGHSLRELDLKVRVFRYRCSPLINSPSFRELPPPLKRRVEERLLRVLSNAAAEPRYAYLGTDERAVIRDLLAETWAGISRR